MINGSYYTNLAGIPSAPAAFPSRSSVIEELRHESRHVPWFWSFPATAVDKTTCQLRYTLTLARTSFFTILERTSGGGGGHGVTLPRHLPPECDKTSQQRPADSLGRFESNGVWVYLFRSAVELPGQAKFRSFVSRNYQFFVNNFIVVWDRALILPPSPLSRQGGSTHILCDTERSLGNFDLTSPKIKVIDWPKYLKSHSIRCVLTRRTLKQLSRVDISFQSKIIKI